MIPALKEAYPDGRKIADEPPVFLFEEFLTPAECAHLVELSEPSMTRAVVSGGTDGVESEGRTGSVNWVQHDQTPTTLAIAGRTARLVGFPLDNAEALQVIAYGPGQEYKPHYDAWVPGTATGDRCLARGGQRLLTCLFYLNSVESGGTFFPRLDIEVMPRQGRLLVFHNCYSGTISRHPGSLHGGMPPAEGTKWACNLWFRAENFRQGSAPMRPTASTRRF